MSESLRPGQTRGDLARRSWGSVFAWVSLFLFSLFCSPAEGDELKSDQIKSLVDRAWHKVETAGHGMSSGRPILWTYQVSPPFPMDWFPAPTRRLCYYAYATGFSVQGGLADAVYVAAPWCRVIVDWAAESPPVLEHLSSHLRKIGIQGFRPITAAEKAVYDQAGSVGRYLSGLTSIPEALAPETRRLKAYYCTWSNHNGTVLPEIQAFHEGFFGWLACE